MSLGAFKQVVREQYFMLLLDEEMAMETLPRLMPEDTEARKDIFDRVLTVTTASGPPSDLRLGRLRALAERFGLDPDSAVDSKQSKRATRKPTASATPARRAS